RDGEQLARVHGTGLVLGSGRQEDLELQALPVALRELALQRVRVDRLEGREAAAALGAFAPAANQVFVDGAAGPHDGGLARPTEGAGHLDGVGRAPRRGRPALE